MLVTPPPCTSRSWAAFGLSWLNPGLQGGSGLQRPCGCLWSSFASLWSGGGAERGCGAFALFSAGFRLSLHRGVNETDRRDFLPEEAGVGGI